MSENSGCNRRSFLSLSVTAPAALALAAGALAGPADAVDFGATERKDVRLPETILYGVAYYDEYTPGDRTEKDAEMMAAAGINVVRIAESTWGTMETAPGVFDFTHIDRTLKAMHRHGIRVIIGTPTYAVPTWLVRLHPDVLVVEPDDRRAQYGRRQNMDITNPHFLAAARRVIIALVDHVRNHPAVIGYQLDNETKAYGTSGPNVQAAFVAEMKRKFKTTDALNKAFGLNYWSNRINRWEDFPSVNGAINASLTNAFEKFQRQLVTNYLAWQAALVRAHARPDQFMTQNFDLDWKGYSYGVQPQVNHWQAAKALDIAGMDIYHPTQDHLTGTEIAFGGDMSRSIRNGQNYLVMETEAQGFPQWTPYPGQLRLQAFSQLAGGANMLEYWHWGTTANGAETYWRGVLAQDYQPNATYAEVKTIGADLRRLGPKLVNMHKENDVAIYVSNTALSAYNAFKPGMDYNQVMRGFYDALYRMNIEADILSPDSELPLDRYKLIIVPALYAASDAEIAKLNAYAKAGGHLLYSFKSGFSNENTQVRYAPQPGAIAEAAGIGYHEFTVPENVTLADDPYHVGAAANKASTWMEFVKPTTAKVLAKFAHHAWPDYAAVTRNRWGRGWVGYVSFMPTARLMEAILAEMTAKAGVHLAMGKTAFPVIVRNGVLNNGHPVHYIFNYSAAPQKVAYSLGSGTELISGKAQAKGATLHLKPWGFAVIEETAA